jgi:hypothetical protein
MRYFFGYILHISLTYPAGYIIINEKLCDPENETIAEKHLCMIPERGINMILSASRRTDIPAYFSEWFINRLKDGFFMTRNPMNYSQIKRIDVSPETVDCIVFWSKDPLNILDKLPLIDKMVQVLLSVHADSI